MIRKILKWTGIIILLLITVISITVALRQNLTYDAPYPDIKASTDSTVIARGKEIVFGAAHCGDCHSTQNVDSILSLGQQVSLSGGHKFDLPFAEIYTRNITPDKETGIGNLTDGEIARLLRYGVKANGTAVIDFMPFHNVTDEDMTAIISYLRSQKPVVNKVPDHTYTVMGKVLKAFLIKPVGPDGEPARSLARDTSAAYGKYLAYSVAECNGCHTVRDMTGGFIGEPFAGGVVFEEEGKPTLTTPNLTTDSSSRIFGWKEEDFLKRFRMGKLIPHSHMPWNAYKRMSDNDLKAIYNFLQTVKPAKAGAIKKPS